MDIATVTTQEGQVPTYIYITIDDQYRDFTQFILLLNHTMH